jgi:signal transduction histidine kinase/CheY-like chemotaxis protein
METAFFGVGCLKYIAVLAQNRVWAQDLANYFTLKVKLLSLKRTDMISKLVAALNLANSEAIIVSMPEAVVIDATTAVLTRWGAQRSDLVGKPILKFGTGLISARLAEASAELNTNSIDVCYTPPLGTALVSRFKSQSLQDFGGNYYLFIGQSMTPEQTIAMQENEHRLSLALRSGGYALWDFNFTTKETYNSVEMLETFGTRVNGKPLDFQSFNELIHPDDRDKTMEDKIRSASFGQDVFQTRYRVKTTAGKYEWIETIAGVIRDPITSRPLKTVGLCRNVDAQMVSLERLKASERNLKRTQAVAKLGSFSLRVDSNVSRLTSEFADLIGMANAMVHPTLKTFIEMIEPNDKERFSEALELAKIGQHIKNLEITVKLPSGELTWFEVSMEPELDSAAKVESIFGCCQSVTERKALERKFQQAQKMEAVGQLTGGIAHDFNNLLMVVMGNLQLVENLVKHDERATKRIRAATEAAEKGSDLTRRMLAFSRQQTLQNKELTVNELIFSMQDMLSQALTAVVELKIMPGKDVWPIKADKTMLETAILNLAINARDAMAPKGGDLIVETANRSLNAEYCADHEDVHPGDYVEISVTDTGSGIAPENIEKVFQPFFTTKGPEKGSGLGLSMIYGFVKQSGGHVKIYSEIDHGTSVKLYIPRMKSRLVELPEAHSPSQLQQQILQELGSDAPAVPTNYGTALAPKSKPTILVVEDNDSVRDVAAAMIEEMGFDVLTAINGPEGLKIIEERRDINLMISDVIMAGGMNGPELVAKAMKIRPKLKVLFMSGYAPGSVRLMQDLPDSVELVNKPFTRNDLTEKVRRALAA